MSAGKTAVEPTSSAHARHCPGFGRMLMLGPLGVEASKFQWMIAIFPFG